MMAKFLIPLALALNANGATAQLTQFNLECVGTNSNIKDGVKKTLPWRTRFRIDLLRRVYCIDECRTLLDIYSITANEITLRQFESAALFDTEIVNRMTGGYIQLSGTKPPVISTDEFNNISAKCDPEPFTGLPQQRF